MYFLKYHGDLEKDPLDKGLECFEDFGQLFDFIDSIKSKGYKTKVYQATELSDQEFRLKILDELTQEAQELGFYD